MDWGAFQAATVGFKTLVDATQAIGLLKTREEVDAVRADLLGKLVTTQQALLELQNVVTAVREENEELEKEISRIRDFQTVRERYQLVALGPGALAYALKEELQADTPPHHLCPQCFEKDKRSILQFAGIERGRRGVLACGACGERVMYPHSGYAAPKVVAVGRSRGGRRL